MTFYNGAETKFSEVQSRQKSNAVREKKGKKINMTFGDLKFKMDLIALILFRHDA